MSTLKKIPCPKCGSSKTPALQPYPDGNGYCFACNTAFSDPYNGVVMEKGSFKNARREFEDMENSSDEWDTPTKPIELGDVRNPDKEYRGLRASVLKKFGVKVEGDLDKVYYPYTKNMGEISGYKIREVDSKMFRSTGELSGADLFGIGQCSSESKRNIIIHEGENDCMATWQLLQDRGKGQDCVACSGANGRNIRTNWEFLDQYDNILILFDSDKPGQLAAKKIAPMFAPGKVRIVTLPEGYKDSHELLEDTKVDGAGLLAKALRTATEQRPDGIVSVDDLFEEALKAPDQGIDYPWPSVNEMTGGIRKGELVVVTAGSGSGKTVFGREMLHHLTMKEDKKVGFFFLEERSTKTLRTLAGMESGVQYHKMHEIENVAQFREDMGKFRDKAFFYDSFGSNNWETIQAKIRYMASALEVEYVVLDNLTALTAEESDEYGSLNMIMSGLAGLSIELDIHIQVISHLRKSQGGRAFEEGAQVSSADLRGSSSINFWAYQILSVERNTQHEDEDIRNTSTIRMLKDRVDGRVGETARLFYQKETGRWIEAEAVPEEDF